MRGLVRTGALALLAFVLGAVAQPLVAHRGSGTAAFLGWFTWGPWVDRALEVVSPVPVVPCPSVDAHCAVDDGYVRRAAWARVAEDVADRGGRFTLPFLDTLQPGVQPEAVRRHVNEWSARCLPRQTFRNLDCGEYPCVFAFAQRDRPDCLDALHAARILNLEATRTIDGVPTSLGVLTEAVFRDPADLDLFGDIVSVPESHVRLRAAAPYGAGAFDEGARVGFRLSIIDVPFDAWATPPGPVVP